LLRIIIKYDLIVKLFEENGMSTSFALALEEARGGISLNMLARTIAGPNTKNARGPVGNLSRLQNGKQEPTKEKIDQIATALGSVRKFSAAEINRLRNRLMSAAGYANFQTAAKLEASESEERRRFRPACHKALQTVHALKDHQIQTILDLARVSTMKSIITAAEKGEEIEVVQLQKISAVLQQTAARSSGAVKNAESPQADTVIEAGRARILIDGDVSPAQLQVLRNAAEMIKSVLKL
jgi:hypothetical protein